MADLMDVFEPGEKFLTMVNGQHPRLWSVDEKGLVVGAEQVISTKVQEALRVVGQDLSLAEAEVKTLNAEAENLKAALLAVRALHRPQGDRCEHDLRVWPCPTEQAIRSARCLT